ncbi:hypothetical protein AURDEDRAFT_177324 [Auricularia subglabra TFB-10046 SS5]|uniref:Uncharacterized protein n=1 Tax=Auricularia subglabra (strain TFB-10046 / SS5) TaxID=717982 RepID=J0WML3_AURST|nr:hypothetical protein AURDEDRAFT_177324 [Auricularia subglabra TFB-10046 SS5]
MRHLIHEAANLTLALVGALALARPALLLAPPSGCTTAPAIESQTTGMLTQNFITVVAGSSTPNDRGQVGPNARLEKRDGGPGINTPTMTISSPPPHQPDAQDRKHKDDFSLDTSELSAAISPALCDLFNESNYANSTAFEDVVREAVAHEIVGSKTEEAAVLRFAQTGDWEPTSSTWLLCFELDLVGALSRAHISTSRATFGPHNNLITVVEGSVGIHANFVHCLEDTKARKNAGDDCGQVGPNARLEKREVDHADHDDRVAAAASAGRAGPQAQ